MDISRGYKYRIYPNIVQEHQLLHFFGCCRFVYNHFLKERKRSYEEDGVTMFYTTTSVLLTRLKADPEHGWLSECDSMALQEALRDLDRAYQNFFGKRAGYPKFRSRKASWQSYRTRNQSDGVRILSNAIVLPKLGAVKAKVSRLLKGRILNAAVSRTSTGKYFVSLCVEEEGEPKPNSGGLLGIDVGIRSFYTGSDGKSVFSLASLHACEKKLRRE